MKYLHRIYHSWDKWESYKAGFYSDGYREKNTEEAKEMYKKFLGDLVLFEKALKKVLKEWRYSCEHFLSNKDINRIAWLGQASACMWLGLPSKYKGGFSLLSIKKQRQANQLAEKYLRIWEEKYINTLKNGKSRAIQMEFRMKFQ